MSRNRFQDFKKQKSGTWQAEGRTGYFSWSLGIWTLWFVGYLQKLLGLEFRMASVTLERPMHLDCKPQFMSRLEGPICLCQHGPFVKFYLSTPATARCSGDLNKGPISSTEVEEGKGMRASEAKGQGCLWA